MACRLDLAVSTIETHRKQIMAKLELRSVAELTKFAIRRGITTLG
jgi:DNA-binding NarL/FixJ family response regulator